MNPWSRFTTNKSGPEPNSKCHSPSLAKMDFTRLRMVSTIYKTDNLHWIYKCNFRMQFHPVKWNKDKKSTWNRHQILLPWDASERTFALDSEAFLPGSIFSRAAMFEAQVSRVAKHQWRESGNQSFSSRILGLCCLDMIWCIMYTVYF